MTVPDLHRLPVATRTEMPVTTLDAIAPQPTLRIRVEHSRTQRDGWGYSTTVEMDGIDASDYRRIDDATAWIANVLEDARKLGEHERDERNQRDNAMKEATSGQ